MYSLFRPLLFRLEPERAHALTLHLLRIAGNTALLRWLFLRQYAARPNPVDAFGLRFRNPVGLAAGYDKDGLALNGLAALGFGHIEIGTVTPLPQRGNPKPRVFRLLEDEAVINRMGFPSRGAAYLRRQLTPKISPFDYVFRRRAPKRSFVLGVNIGKNKDTPNEEAALDYLALVQDFAPHADYLTVNVSSPNTAGLRRLQGRDALEELLMQIHKQRGLEERNLNKRLPILVKLSPDLTPSELEQSLDAVLQTGMDGVILTNTTVAREGVRSSLGVETGGLSGSPLRVKSEAALRRAVKCVRGKIPIVSAGGIMNPNDAKRRLEMGAALVQIYTGLIYRGPSLVREIINSLA